MRDVDTAEVDAVVSLDGRWLLCGKCWERLTRIYDFGEDVPGADDSLPFEVFAGKSFGLYGFVPDADGVWRLTNHAREGWARGRAPRDRRPRHDPVGGTEPGSHARYLARQFYGSEAAERHRFREGARIFALIACPRAARCGRVNRVNYNHDPRP